MPRLICFSDTLTNALFTTTGPKIKTAHPGIKWVLPTNNGSVNVILVADTAVLRARVLPSAPRRLIASHESPTHRISKNGRRLRAFSNWQLESRLVGLNLQHKLNVGVAKAHA